MTEEKESSGALLGNEALLRRVLEREPSLVSRIVSHADFTKALFARPEALRGLMRAPLIADDYHFEQLLASVGGDGASLRARPVKAEARLLHLLNDEEAVGRLLQKQPELAGAVSSNPAFVTQVKVREPHIYRALLEKAEKRFAMDTGLAAEIQAERESFISEDERNREAERRLREAGKQLMDAVRLDRANDVRALLEKGTDPNFQDDYGRSVLMLAAWYGHVKAAQALLEGGADPNFQDDCGHTALMNAAWMAHFEVVRPLLKHGADPNVQTKKGWTVLMTAAARNGRRAERNLLLEHGADPNLQNEEGETALMIAARDNCEDAVRALLKHGANPSLQNKDGKSARDVAATRSIAQVLAAAEREQGRRGELGYGRGR